MHIPQVQYDETLFPLYFPSSWHCHPPSSHQARNLGALEFSLSLMPHGWSLCQFRLPNSSRIYVLFSILYSLPLRLASSSAPDYCGSTWPGLCSRLVPLKTPPTPIYWHNQSKMPWTFISCKIKFMKANMTLQNQASPHSLFSTPNTPTGDLFLLLPTTHPETEVASSYSWVTPVQGHLLCMPTHTGLSPYFPYCIIASTYSVSCTVRL